MPPQAHQTLPPDPFSLPREQKQALISLLDERIKRTQVQKQKDDLISFAKAVYPPFLTGAHHRHIAKIFRAVLDGTKKRVIINIAPRHGKSWLASYLFPAWFLGHKPNSQIIMATHTAKLSEEFGRLVRNLISTPEYQDIFPGTSLSEDSKSAGSWHTSSGGVYRAVGVGGSIAGKGADLCVIDDAHSEQDARSGSRLVFDQAWQWYQTGPRQRMQAGGAIVVLMCMTGDTPVLMADGTEKPLRDIRPMDEIATYENGMLATTKVLNWQSSGVDSIYTLRTRFGKILRANERHPFLVECEEERKWVRLQNLKPGMYLVAKKAASALQDRKQNRGFVAPVKLRSHTIRDILTRHIIQWGTMVSGKVRPVHMKGVKSPSSSKDFASIITNTIVGEKATAQRHTPQRSGVVRGSSTVMGLLRKGSIVFSKVKMVFARCAINLLQKAIPAPIGAINFASITTTLPERFGGYSATTATSQWGMQKLQQQQKQWQNISDFMTDQIVEIAPAGREEVFDVEIERTENFIANGFVSHNTRWSLLDLTGRLIDYQIKNPDADQWEVVEFPAILNENTENEKSLWPEMWKLEELQKTRASMDPRYWQSQYIQNPTSEVAAIIKREYWQIWDKEDPPVCSYLMMSADTAHTVSDSADYSACTTWGVFYRDITIGRDAGKQQACIILLDAFRDRMEFPELKEVLYKHWKEWNPDTFLIEKKAAGAPLIQEFRRMGIPVQEYTPSRAQRGTSNDKIARLNAVADMFVSGMVWAPDRRWAKDVIEEVASFPAGEHDDFVDTVSQALLRFRQGGFITLDSDEQEEAKLFRRRTARPYY